MKRLISITIINLFVSSIGICQMGYAFGNCFFYTPTVNKNDLINNHLVGKVKTVTTSTYQVKQNFGNPIKGQQTGCKETTNYDNKGNITECYAYIEKYNSHTKRKDFTKTLTKKYVYKYDNNGNILEIKEYEGNGNLNITVTRNYDNNGNIIEETIQCPNMQDVHFTIKNKYNQKGNVEIIEQYFRDTNSATFTTICKYDEGGALIGICVNDNEHMGNLKMISKYDNNKNLIENDNGRSDSTTYKYDITGNLIEQTYDNNRQTKLFKYSNIDKWHNWNSMLEDDSKAIIERGVETPQKITERTIEYYQ